MNRDRLHTRGRWPERRRTLDRVLKGLSQGVLRLSIWSKSPYPLRPPPPPDHCHIRAYLDALVWPPKNLAQVEVPDRHQPYGWWVRLLVNASYVHSYVLGISEAVPVPKIWAQMSGAEYTPALKL